MRFVRHFTVMSGRSSWRKSLRIRLPVGVTLAGLALIAAAVADAHPQMPDEISMPERMRRRPPPNTVGAGVFNMIDPPLGDTVAPPRAATGAAGAAGARNGGTIVAWKAGALLVEPDSGALFQVDAAGEPLGKIDVGRDAAQVVVDAAGGRAYVSDRAGDRIVVVKRGDALGKAMTIERSIKTRAEPFGLALAPDGQTLLVTTIADRSLSALDVSELGAKATSRERWSLDVGPEPRAIAISPDGTQAIVTFLTISAALKLELDAGGRGGRPAVHWIPLAPPPPAAIAQ